MINNAGITLDNLSIRLTEENWKKVIDINLAQNGQPKLTNWSTSHYHDNNVIGYLPKSKELIIVNKNNNILFYDLKSESWRQSNVFGSRDITNLLNFNNGDLYWWSSVAGLMGNPDTIDLVKWDKTPSTKSGSQVLYQTKEFDMGSAATNKNYNTLYINYYFEYNSTMNCSLMFSGI